jgi:hypothetical protein
MRVEVGWCIQRILGGVIAMIGYGIAVDGSGNAYVTGCTSSTDYDVTLVHFRQRMGEEVMMSL